MTTPVAEWVEWTGGLRPHPASTLVRVQYRDGSEEDVQSAFVHWWHEDNGRDIIAYRIADVPALTDGEGESRRVNDLLDANNRYLERARTAEAQASAYKERVAQLEAELERVREAGQAVVDRWDSPLWKDAEPTAHVVNRLRTALNREG